MEEIVKQFEERFKLQKEFLDSDEPVNQIIPLVSVCITTYQHKNYIKDCIESVLMQKTDFQYEIIIGEDESTDGTREICKQYAEENPDYIRLYLRDRNISNLYDENGNFITRFNGIWLRKSARGKYIAICEGDDYWIDPLKLQKQIDFMEENHEYSLCFHNSIELWDNSIKQPRLFCQGEMKDSYSTTDLIVNQWFIPTQSILFRTDYIKIVPDWVLTVYNGDYSLELLLSLKGHIKYMPDIMAVYRRNQNSMSATAGRNYTFVQEKMFYLLDSFNKETNYRFNKEIILKKKTDTRYYRHMRYRQKLGVLYLLFRPYFVIKLVMKKLKG